MPGSGRGDDAGAGARGGGDHRARDARIPGRLRDEGRAAEGRRARARRDHRLQADHGALTDARVMGEKLLVKLLIADADGERMLKDLQDQGTGSASPDEDEDSPQPKKIRI